MIDQPASLCLVCVTLCCCSTWVAKYPGCIFPGILPHSSLRDLSAVLLVSQFCYQQFPQIVGGWAFWGIVIGKLVTLICSAQCTLFNSDSGIIDLIMWKI